jgi:hypothetical protein
MKKKAVETVSIFVIFLLCIDTNISSAQIIAGSVPPGTSIQYPNIMLSNSLLGSTVSDSFDIDCDNIKDIALDLIRANGALDFPNLIMLRILSDSVEVCKDTSSPYVVPLYNVGDTLCNGFYTWRADSVNRLACGGGFCWNFLYEASGKYFAYRKTATQQIGWIKISYDLAFQNTITDTVNEILVLCIGNGTGDIGRELFVSISPNPTTDGKIKLQCKNKITQIEIRNALGQVVKVIPGSETDITLPEETGLYIIMVIDDNGNFRTEKIWRQ